MQESEKYEGGKSYLRVPCRGLVGDLAAYRAAAVSILQHKTYLQGRRGKSAHELERDM
jgi:hypothetical protein